MKIAVMSDEHFPHTGAETQVIVNSAAALAKQGGVFVRRSDISAALPWQGAQNVRTTDILTALLRDGRAQAR